MPASRRRSSLGREGAGDSSPDLGRALRQHANFLRHAPGGVLARESGWSAQWGCVRSAIAGFAAFKNHLSYLPHSGSVFPQLKDELKGYATSLGALRFDIGRPLPAPLVEKLIAVRLRQAFPG